MEQPYLKGNKAHSVVGALPGRSVPGAWATLGGLTMQCGMGALSPAPGSPEGPQAESATWGVGVPLQWTQ